MSRKGANYSIRELIEPIHHLVGFDMRMVEPTKPDTETPMAYLGDQRRMHEDVVMAFAEIALSNPWWPGALARAVGSKRFRRQVARALDGDDLVRKDPAAKALLAVFEDLGRHHPWLPVHLFSWLIEPSIAAANVHTAGLLDDALRATGERKAIATMVAAKGGLFEPLYDSYARSLLVCLSLQARRQPSIPTAFGAVINRIAELAPPSVLFDADAAFFRNAMMHGHALHDASGRFVTLTNHGPHGATRTERLGTRALLRRLLDMHRVASQSTASALGVFGSRLLGRSGAIDWALTELRSVLHVGVDADERNARIGPFLAGFGERFFSAFGLHDIANVSGEGHRPTTPESGREGTTWSGNV